VYTQWLNHRGGIEADLTVTREAEDRYLIVSACATRTRDFAWLRRHIPSEAQAFALDVSAAYAVLGVMGPQSRALLSSITDADLCNEAFPFGTSKMIDLGYARVRASRITYVGELGWELYMESDFAQAVYDQIIAVGSQYGLVHAGYHALNSLRMEKAYRHWGHDITDEDTPLEAGLGFTVDWSKRSGFTGREALLRQRDQGMRRRLAAFVLDTADPLLYHGEPIWREGKLVGRITSAMFGYSVGRPIGLGYVGNGTCGVTPDWVTTGRYEIEIATERFPAKVSLKSIYDPPNQRVRS